MPRSKPSFPGFPPEALKFLASLAKNNNKDWFDKNKEIYETKVKAPMIELVGALGGEMLAYAPDYIPEPKKAVFRIYRDVRFSKEKIPYKTNVAASFWRQNLGKNEGAFFYLHIDMKEVFVAGGVYNPMPDHLKMYREHIAGNHAAMNKILKNKKRSQLLGDLHGQSMQRLPKGYLPGHPAEDVLKRKMFIYAVTLDQKIALTPRLLPEVSLRFAAMTPLVEFLNEPMLARAKKSRLDFQPM